MMNVEVKFLLIKDSSKEVAKKYGMVQLGESKIQAVRVVYFIDPKGIVRAIIYDPLSLGRNFDEIYRALVEMQTADGFGVVTPTDWNPGYDVIVLAARTYGGAEERMTASNDVECSDWFFCTKKLSEEEVLRTILKK